MVDTVGTVAQQREYYHQIMQKVRKLNDKILIELISKKLAHLNMKSAISTTSGGIIIPFPAIQSSTECNGYERPTLWMIFKLTLAIPGSLAALLLMALYRM